MAKTVLSGTRIRDHRAAKGLRQVELAKRCGISPSYLNLIEHNRRRIGGALLLKIAAALETDPSVLAEGAEAALATALDAAAEAHGDTGAERDRLEELVSRFPGWARLIEAQYVDMRRLEQVVERLDDRLTHDPFLSASMHNVLTSAAGIRSASAILAGEEKIEPEWQARFHRNIYEDSQRLAEATETLVEYLDSEDNNERDGRLPQDEFDRWLAARAWRIAELDEDPDRPIDEILHVSDAPASAAARDLARRHVRQYARDAKALSLDTLSDALEDDTTPEDLAARFDLPLPIVFRRLAALPVAQLPGQFEFRAGRLRSVGHPDVPQTRAGFRTSPFQRCLSALAALSGDAASTDANSRPPRGGRARFRPVRCGGDFRGEPPHGIRPPGRPDIVDADPRGASAPVRSDVACRHQLPDMRRSGLSRASRGFGLFHAGLRATLTRHDPCAIVTP